MTPKKKLMEQAIAILQEKGQKAVELAKQAVMQERIQYKPLREALHYFIEDWNDVLHPALVSLACEAVGGNPDATTQIGAAMVLLAGGADIHDDIIDQSEIKGSKQTVYGKFGKEISILVGDALLLKGTYLLHEACEPLPKRKKKAILDVIRQAFFEISSAEAEEAGLRGRIDISGREYLSIIRHKVAAGEAATRIGAIISNGKPNEIEILGHYGRTYGILMTIRDEFVDVFEPDELKNRVEKECLPLPILLAFQDSSKKALILQLLKEEITEDKVEKILDLIMNSKETLKLKKEMERLVKIESQEVTSLKNCRETFNLLLCTTIEDL